ncbi:hypothetical protein DY037_01595 [Apilactobacillus micheneri]|uniref:hypothetical protein n=1 Tax=Apilactobacillus micheneri TaxID=1899430 RepID=UPI00112EBB36|nr:hypothetical protein [Apilactobacillus micheneri]TPR39147.1 hypothetical protein DY119_05660 [Apilactobacillus micheneri]TPR50669.1 hypothetical protein DY037_01595 [Apilactobacillus micheneri]
MQFKKISMVIIFFSVIIMPFNQYIKADEKHTNTVGKEIKTETKKSNNTSNKHVNDSKETNIISDNHPKNNYPLEMNNDKNSSKHENAKMQSKFNSSKDEQKVNDIVNNFSINLSNLNGLTDWKNWQIFNQHGILGYHDLSDESSTKGTTSIYGYNNDVTINDLGSENGNNYIDMTYGSPGDKGGEYRYVNFQMMLSKEMLNIVDKNKTMVSYNQSNETKNLSHYFTSNNNIIYNFKFDSKYYHSGYIKVHLVLKNSININVNNQLLDMYYKSDNNRKELFNKKSNDYIRFETIQTFYYQEIYHYATTKLDNIKNKLIDEVNQNQTLLDTEKQSLIEQIKSHNISTYNSSKNINKLINELLEHIENLNNISLLKLRDTGLSNIQFKDAQTNNSNSEVLISPKFSIGFFNIRNLQINLTFTNLENHENKNYKLKGLKFISNGQTYEPETQITYYTSDYPNFINDNINKPKEFKMHFNEHTSPSGNYQGEIMWTVSYQIPKDNGIQIK